MHENTATNIRHWFYFLDQGPQKYGGSLWLKINCHIYAALVYMNENFIKGSK